MDRREFIKTSAAAAAATGLAACRRDIIDWEPDTTISGEMEMRTSSRTGDKVSLLGYGCMRWQMIDGPDGKKIVDQESVNELVDRAIEMGVNYFDSSPVYLMGQSEQATAKALQRHPRESYYIATKLSNFSNWSYENSVLMYRKSLENYNTDHIDYYLLHSFGRMEDFNTRFANTGMMDFLMKEREAGHIRNLGFSFHGGPDSFEDILTQTHDKYHWDFVQIQMNYVDWNSDSSAKRLYDALTSRGIQVVIMEPLLGGALSNVPDYIAEQFKEKDPARSVASWAFRFCGTWPNVLTVLSGMTYREHLEDNLKSFCGFTPLSEAELEFVDGMGAKIREFPTVPCTGCQYCMPCPYGIDIPGNFAHYNKCVNEGLVIEQPSDDENDSEERKAFKKARRKFLADLDRHIDPDRQADHCISCGKCLPKCPQHIRIPSELLKISRYTDKIKGSL